MQRVLFILGVLEDEDVDWLIAAGCRQELPCGEVLIREGRSSEALYLLLDGALDVSVAALEQPVAQLSSGEVVGEMSFVDEQPPSATVSAAADSVLLAVPCDALKAKLHQDMRFAARFYQAVAILLSSRLRSTVKHLQGEHWRPVAIATEPTTDTLEAIVSLGAIRFDWMLRRLCDLSGNPWEALEEQGSSSPG